MKPASERIANFDPDTDLRDKALRRPAGSRACGPVEHTIDRDLQRNSVGVWARCLVPDFVASGGFGHHCRVPMHTADSLQRDPATSFDLAQHRTTRRSHSGTRNAVQVSDLDAAVTANDPGRTGFRIERETNRHHMRCTGGPQCRQCPKMAFGNKPQRCFGERNHVPFYLALTVDGCRVNVNRFVPGGSNLETSSLCLSPTANIVTRPGSAATVTVPRTSM
jgi:hypothetical protein